MVALELQEHLQLMRETYQTYEHHLVPVNINITAEIIARTKDIRTSITKSGLPHPHLHPYSPPLLHLPFFKLAFFKRMSRNEPNNLNNLN